MAATVLRGSFRKKGPRIVTYREYSGFDNFSFREEPAEELSSNPLKMLDFTLFNSTVECILNKLAQLKKKYLRANDGPSMTRELRKAIMKRSNLKNKFNKIRTNESWAAYKRQRNLCVGVLRQNKKSYYARLDRKTVSDNKKFWKTVKLLFSNKIQSASCITLLENDVVESDEGKVAEIMNNYIVNITETLGISRATTEGSLNDFNEDPCSNVIKHFESHSSILKIKGSVSSDTKFSFRKATFDEMLEQLKNLDPKEASPQESILPKTLKTNADLFCFPLVELFNRLVQEGSFPNDLKCADVSSLFKKGDTMFKENYRPISLLPAI